jgi:surface polysaccharide O-acyltransferase-like enzyme
MDNLRAIAISSIVFNHGYKPDFDSFISKTIGNLNSGNSALFVFISGYFLHKVFYKKIAYKNLVIKKFIAIGIPYLLLSSSILLLRLLVQGSLPTFKGNWSFLPYTNDFITYLQFILVGSAVGPYWYIPFILLIFLLTPIFYIFIDLDLRVQIFIMITAFIFASCVWRPIISSPTHSLIYYLPFYLFGIMSSQHDKSFHFYVTKYWLLVLLALSSIIIVMSSKDLVGYRYKADIFSYSGIDYSVCLKILLIMFLIFLLTKFLNFRVPAMSLIANYSFPVYFLHQPIIMALAYLKIITKTTVILPDILVLFLVVMSISMLITFVFRTILGDKSKFIIG